MTDWPGLDWNDSVKGLQIKLHDLQEVCRLFADLPDELVPRVLRRRIVAATGVAQAALSVLAANISVLYEDPRQE